VLLPPELLSVCDCVCPKFPDSSAINWVNSSGEERASAFERVGLTPDRWDEARSWATSEFDSSFGWPNVFYSARSALAARERFFGSTSPLAAVGIGLSRGTLDAFIAETTPPQSPEGFAPIGESALLQMARRGEPLAIGYRVLGFELLNVEMRQLSHSWLCNNLETYFSDTLGIKPNARGFIDTLEAAEQCCDAINREEVGAEPGPWFPLWLVEYA
jgi:hypothetical protein